MSFYSLYLLDTLPASENPIIRQMEKYSDIDWVSYANWNPDQGYLLHSFFAVAFVVVAFLCLMYLGHSLDHEKRLSQRRPQPPMRAEFALYLILNGNERDAAVGDLIERYPKMVKRFGKRKADLWAWSQVIRSIGPILRRLVTAGGLLTAAAIIRKVFGEK